jgi:hypothetical protein
MGCLSYTSKMKPPQTHHKYNWQVFARTINSMICLHRKDEPPNVSLIFSHAWNKSQQNHKTITSKK